MDHYNIFQPDDDDIQEKDQGNGEQQINQHDELSTNLSDESNEDQNNNLLFSAENNTDAAATYEEGLTLAAAFADPAQPPQSLAFLQQQQKEQELAAKKKIVGFVYKKAPAAPKRWKSSYIHFFTDFIERKKRMAQIDGMCKGKKCKLDMHEIAKEASKAWKVMPANEKQHWQQISKKDKEDYEKRMSEFEGPMHVRTDKVKKKDLDAPKRSPPAFFLYCKVKGAELKELNPKTSHSAIVKECGKFWRNMSETEKAPYREEEQRLRAQYHVDIKKWKDAKMKEQKEAEKRFEEERMKLVSMLESNEPEAPKEVVVAAAVTTVPLDDDVLDLQYKNAVEPVLEYAENLLEKPRTKKRKNHDGKREDDDLPKRSPSAFFIFCGHYRERIRMDNPGISYPDVLSTLSKNWKEMTDIQKKPFRDKEEELRQQYHFKMTFYRKNKKNKKLKGGFEEQQQQQQQQEAEQSSASTTAQVVQADATVGHKVTVPPIPVQMQQQPLAYAPLPHQDVQEAMNYQQGANYQDQNNGYQHELSYADYVNMEPINVSTATKAEGDEQEESGEYNQNQISHQAYYGAMGEYFCL